MLQPSNQHRESGFTLIEVLLALMIFSTLSMAANQIFRIVLDSNTQTEEIGNSLKSLQRTILIMNSDFRQIMARPYRDGGEEAKEQLIELSEGFLDSDSDGIRFVRGGWINPQQLYPRGDVVKVGYRVQDETLQRIRWMYPDDSSAVEPALMPVMEGVTSIKFEVYNDEKWQNSWDKPFIMPKALRVKLETKRYGELTHIYLLPGQTLPNSSSGDSANGG